jgi:hypothetical protein
MNKNTKILLIVFVILLGVYFLFFRSKDRISSDKIDSKLFTADSSKIDKIEIVRTADAITIEKVNGIWMITKPVNYQADTNMILPILGNFKNMTIEGVASTNMEKFPAYLDSANHPVVTVYQEGKALGTFEVGKMSGSYENSFIRKKDDNRILIASSLNSNNFTKPLKDYRIKTITSILSGSVKSIQFKSTDSTKVDFEVKKDTADKWYIGKDSVSAAVMGNILNTLNNITAEDFKDTTITTFPVPTFTTTINGVQPVVMNFYREPNTSNPVYFIMQVSGIKQLFRVSEAGANMWMKKKKDFIPEAPPKK